MITIYKTTVNIARNKNGLGRGHNEWNRHIKKWKEDPVDSRKRKQKETNGNKRKQKELNADVLLFTVLGSTAKQHDNTRQIALRG
jgi:hypothetical protein